MSNNYHASFAPLHNKLVEEAIANDPSWNFISCIYKTKIDGMSRNITTTWSKNLINIALHIVVENLSNHEDPHICKVDVNTWQFWGKKGVKSFKVDEKRIDVYWNFRDAKFSTAPEPCSDYNVALVCDQEIILLLGDQEKEALERAKSISCSEKPTLILKEENIFGKKSFTTKTMLGKGESEHHIIIEAALYESFEPEMLIGIDGDTSIRIANLHWRFRGHEEIMVDGLSVQVFWDVHDWLYTGTNIGLGIFVFRQSTNEFDPSKFSCNETISADDSVDFCHFLHVWKID